MALNDRVLLLNQTYEPLGTVSVARAITMTFVKDTVFVEEWDGEHVLRSARAEFRVPSVIRRRTYINIRRRREQSRMRQRREPKWRKYLSMDVHDDRDVMDKVYREQKRLGKLSR